MPIRPRLLGGGRGPRCVALVAGVQGRRTSTTPACSSSSARCCSTRRGIARRSKRSARRVDDGFEDRSPSRRASGVVKSALRLGEFIEAQKEATTLKQQDPRSADVHRDARRRACGRRACSTRPTQEFSDALALAPDLSRGHHGLARALASQNKLEEALNEAQTALKLSPRDEEIHHTVGAIFERMRRYEQAAAAYTNYVNLLPNKDRSDKAAWSRVADPLPASRSASASRSRWTTGRRSSSTPWTSASSTTR